MESTQTRYSAAGVAGIPVFEYQPLPDFERYIRVFRMLPADCNGDVVRGEIEVVPRELSEDAYEAISYIWGDPDLREPIICDGKVLSVTHNLADALRRFRGQSTARCVWADSICINQNDNEEKKHQVKRMGQVYGLSKGTLVWLGRDINGIAEDCFELVQETLSILDDQFRKHDHWSFPQFPTSSLLCDDKSRWLKLEQFFRADWHGRVWVIQETALAKQCTIHWGDARIAIENLVEMAWWLSWRGDLFQHRPKISSGRVCENFAQMQVGYGKVTTKTWTRSLPFLNFLAEQFQSIQLFTNILDTAREAKATDGRDFVYAFLGHPSALREDGDLIVEPDYTLPIKEVYIKTALALLRHPREAHWVLGRVIHESTRGVRDGEFPSWVPQWSNGWFQHPIGGPLYSYRAGGPTTEFQHRYSKTSNSLTVQGFVFERLSWTSIILSRANFSLDPKQWSQGASNLGEPPIDLLWKDVLAAANCAPDKLESLQDAFSSSVAAGYSRIAKPNANQHENNSYLAFLELSRANLKAYRQSLPINNASPETIGDPFDFYFRTRHSHNRRLAFTEKGRLCLVDALCEPDDVCCIVKGLPTPFVLRPANNGEFYLVGAAYIHDAMQGELMIELDRGSYILEDIVIR